MEGVPNYVTPESVEAENARLQRITFAKNMIQMQLALRKGFDGSDESKNPEHFFERYSKTFGDLVKENPDIIEGFYTHQNNLEPFIEGIEHILEDALPPSLRQ